MKETILLFIILAVALFHVFWYMVSRLIAGRKLPDEEVIRTFQSQSFKRLGIDVNMDIIEEGYIDANGFRIHMDILACGEGCPTVVFVPGTSVYAQIYVDFMHALHKQGFNVVGFDPRGHGSSTGPRGDYTINGIVDDTLAVVDYAKKRFGVSVAIAGSSQGGMVAFYAAARDDSLAAAVCHNIADLNGKDNLVLSTLRMPVWSVPLAKFMMSVYKSYAVPISLYLDLRKEKLKDGTDAATFVKRDPLSISWITLKALGSLMNTDLAKPVEEINVPVMLVHAERDNIFPQEYVEGIFDKLTCEKEYLLLRDKEHLVMTNDVPEIIEPISMWLKKIGRAVSGRTMPEQMPEQI